MVVIVPNSLSDDITLFTCALVSPALAATSATNCDFVMLRALEEDLDFFAFDDIVAGALVSVAYTCAPKLDPWQMRDADRPRANAPQTAGIPK